MALFEAHQYASLVPRLQPALCGYLQKWESLVSIKSHARCTLIFMKIARFWSWAKAWQTKVTLVSFSRILASCNYLYHNTIVSRAALALKRASTLEAAFFCSLWSSKLQIDASPILNHRSMLRCIFILVLHRCKISITGITSFKVCPCWKYSINEVLRYKTLCALRRGHISRYK